MNPYDISALRLKLACMWFGTEEVNGAVGPECQVQTRIEPNVAAVNTYLQTHELLTAKFGGICGTVLYRAPAV